MHWNEVPGKVAELYQSAASWVYDHPVEADLIIIGAVAFCIYKFYNRQYRRRHRKFRIIRGCWMSREERERLQKMRYEDALVEASWRMIEAGEMSVDEEKRWYRKFAEAYDMAGLWPSKTVQSIIKGCRTRIAWLRKTPKPNTFGLPEVKSDPNYSGGASVLAKSKYAHKPG